MSHSAIQLIVGLGNPGAEYERTRHNAGAWLVLELAHKLHATLRFEPKFQGMHSLVRFHDQDCHIFIPSTYMNNSGQAIKALSRFYKITPESILIAHDDIDLPVGVVRLKFDGGTGGHNGLNDTISHLNTQKFYRLRIGVGHPGHSHEVIDYVLKPPKKTEREQIDMALQRAESIFPLLLKGDFQKAMHQLHTQAPPL